MNMQEVYPILAEKKNKSVSIKKYRNKREFNVGLLLFAIIFLYLIVTVIRSLTGTQIAAYEVREGSIVRDNSYTGLVIREETAVLSEGNGYVIYYQNENSKVKAGSNIYALSPNRLEPRENTGQTDTSTAELNAEVQSAIVLQIQNFNENYRENDFSSVYTLKNEVISSLQDALSETKTDYIGAAIAASGQNVTSYQTSRDGIVAFTVDGCESLTAENFTEKDFDRSDYENTLLQDQMKVQTGDPVYRLITSDNWSVIVPLSDETAAELAEDEVSRIRVRIDKDSETMVAGFSIIEKDGKSYGRLDFDNSMIRYAEERYLSIELILEDESGLKIPRSSVVEEDFFVVPGEYITTGGNSSSNGVMISDGNGNATFQSVGIYSTSEDGEVYLSRDELKEGDILIRPDSTETFTVGAVKPLTGVYNINRGYAVFRKVTILCESDEFYIVQEGDSYGLSNYDHIVQDGSTVDPDEVVFQ